MTRIISGLLMVLFALTIPVFSHGQVDVTKFLGIPVDGYKPELIKKLKNKGFTLSPISKEVLVGEFNGKKVNLHIGTHNNKVYRIMVAFDNHVEEGDIKIMFNNLYQQFKDNKRYLSLSDDMISDEEDISYQMSVKDKRYQAIFYQLPEAADSSTINKEIAAFLIERYTKEQLANKSEDFQNELITQCMEYLRGKYSKKTVWFMINEQYGEYFITIFYDNVYNQASGDEL